MRCRFLTNEYNNTTIQNSCLKHRKRQMESGDCVDSVNDLACILETFFKGLSECGFLSTYSVQLQAVGSDVAVHLQFRQLIYQAVKMLQGLMRRLSKIPGCESMTMDSSIQTERESSYSLRRRSLYLPTSHNVDSKKILPKVSSEIPMKILMTGAKSPLDSNVRSDAPALPSVNVIESDGGFSDGLRNNNPTTALSCLSSADSPNLNQPNSLEDMAHLNGKITKLPLSARHSNQPSEVKFPMGSERQRCNPRILSSPLSSSVLNPRKTFGNQSVCSNRMALIVTNNPDEGSEKIPMERHHILDSTCSEYSDANQIHSIATSSALVSQDLIAVLGSEDVSSQQQPAVLYLSAEDPREEILNDGSDLQERQLDGRNIRIEVEDENVHHGSSIYSYSDDVRKDNSDTEKNMKVDIVTSLRDNEDDLVLFCKDEVELGPLTSVEAVEKDGELMSIFTPDSVKEDEDDSATILYANENVLNAKKSDLNNIVSGKDTISDHLFSKKLVSANGRGSDFGLIGIKIEDLNSRCSEEDPTEFSKRHSEESCAQLPAEKDGQGNGEDIIGIEGDIDPEDELGSNFVHIVVTASRVMPDDANGEKGFDVPHKFKCVRCEQRNGSECTCNACETAFPMLSNVQCQLKKKHGYVSQCDFCHKVFPTIARLVDHCRDVHDGMGCFECEECGKRLKSRLSLKRHMESHQGRKEAVCSKCGKTFCRWDYLIRHCQMVHAKERPYQCSQCSQRFLSRGHLQNHLAVHSGERNHKCGICGKMFSRGDKLREHTFRHSSTKRYSCSTCGRSYADKRDLNKHQIREPSCKAVKRVQVKSDSNYMAEKSTT